MKIEPTLSECDREMFDEFLSLQGNAQPNITSYDEKIWGEEERVIKLNYNRSRVCTKKELSYLLTISLHFILIIKWYEPLETILDATFVVFSFWTASFNNPGKVFILHRTVEFKGEAIQMKASEERKELPDLMHLRILLSNI